MTRRKAQLQHSRVPLGLCESPCDPRIAFRRAIAAFLFEGPRFRVLGRTNESPSFRTGFRLPSPAPVQPFPAEPRSGPGRWPPTSRVRACEARPQAPHPNSTSKAPSRSAPR